MRLRRVNLHVLGRISSTLRLWGQTLYSTYGPTADTGGLFQNGAPVVYRGDTEMAITWIFEHEGDRSYVQRQDGVDQISIQTWSHLEQDSMTVHSEHDAVQLIQAIEQELESRGWTLIECCTERRQGGDRRQAPRTHPDRRCHGS